MKKIFVLILSSFTLLISPLSAKTVRYADLSYQDVREKSVEIMSQHASYHTMTDELAQRVLERFLFELDPFKVYFLHSEVEAWTSPKPEMLREIVAEFAKGSFSQFEAICDARTFAVKRNESLESFARTLPKPNYVQAENLKDVDWANDVDQLLFRVRSVQALEENVLARFEPELRTQAHERFEKRKKMVLGMDSLHQPQAREKVISTLILKAFAEALDSQTAYFAPLEAEQFLIAIQQRLFGIGVLFKDDIDGFTIIELVEGGPAAKQGQLKVHDKIIAVNGEPVVGSDIFEVVSMIRGKENTYVDLTLIREGVQKEPLTVRICRGEVLVQESRLESKIIPSSVGPIAHIHLRSFYQDEQTSACKDVQKALVRMMNEQQIAGVVLDVRGNPGGILQQAVEVCGLFMDNALICSIKEQETVYPFWNIDVKKIWDGPVVVLTDRTSASASEIVAQAFQDWGRGVVVGDDRTFGKGSFQTTSFIADASYSINPKGECKITRGRYYTASGKTPQLVGVKSDIEVCSPFRFMKVGEEFSQYPLQNDRIPSYFDYEPFFKEAAAVGSLKEGLMRMFSRGISSFVLQQRSESLPASVPFLKHNSQIRLQQSQEYQAFLQRLQRDSSSEDSDEEKTSDADFQLHEAVSVLQDLVQMTSSKDMDTTQVAA